MRKPQYTTDREWRIVSVPNGLWQLQRDGQGKGTRMFDPWVKQSHSVEWSEALAMLNARQPKKKAGVA